MRRCAYCRALIVRGWTEIGGKRFCNGACWKLWKGAQEDRVRCAWEVPVNLDAVAKAARAAGLSPVVDEKTRALYQEGRWPEYPEEWRPPWERS